MGGGKSSWKRQLQECKALAFSTQYNARKEGLFRTQNNLSYSEGIGDANSISFPYEQSNIQGRRKGIQLGEPFFFANEGGQNFAKVNSVRFILGVHPCLDEYIVQGGGGYLGVHPIAFTAPLFSGIEVTVR